MIKKSAENNIYLPEKQIINNTSGMLDEAEKSRKEFLRQTNIERYYLLNQEHDIYLTKREAECAVCAIEGATAKQVAKQLGISFRTVESHLQKIKAKLNCDTKDQLVETLIDANITDIVKHR